MFLWTTPTYYSPYQLWVSHTGRLVLEKIAGPFEDNTAEAFAAPPASVPVATKA